MTQPTRPPIAKLVPDSAPFTPEQRTWLNGFFAGFLELGGAGITAFAGGERCADVGPDAGRERAAR